MGDDRSARIPPEIPAYNRLPSSEAFFWYGNPYRNAYPARNTPSVPEGHNNPGRNEFVHNLNPVNLIDSSKEVRKSR